MQWPHLNTTDSTGEEKSNGFLAKSHSSSAPWLKPDGSVLRQLLAASKDAEALIACLFELHFITAVPLEQIWDNLAKAITAAQEALRMQL